MQVPHNLPRLLLCAIGIVVLLFYSMSWSTSSSSSSAPTIMQNFEETTPAAAFVAGEEGVDRYGTSSLAGDYDDPNHPQCLRKIRIRVHDKTTAIVSGTDGTPGCHPNGAGREWVVHGRIAPDHTTIVVDFSSKGGPPALKGVKTPDGILWSDNNLWKNKE